ncbi:CRISPR-associated endonuclease Cas1 [Pelagibius sp. Alg239-R121]|uniref:CRISPR-associated endonuclease Cas1 n=1 Tax=Pelagibius sp. Alg239-R121 TaxID=2993448 RepID=UPI0024A659B9|nr:CRISPR-associated endonuclease Cas1 [Pelagibius sp. Alg239-R121]
MRDGTYRPGPVRELSIPKDDGSFRPLAIPSIGDRVAQTAAASVLGPLLDREMEDASFAYRAGRSVQMAVSRIARYRRDGYRWVVDGDIERYFENVPHDPLLERLGRSIEDPLLLDLLALWLESFSEGGRGLPQGAPLSPLLANLYLDDVDEAIEGKGVRLVRFADDFLLMCKGEETAREAQTRMAGILAEQGLRLNPEKTRVVPFEKGFRFLGHLFVRSMIIQELRDDDPKAPMAVGITGKAIDPESGTSGSDGGVTDGGQRAPILRVLYVYERGRKIGLRNQAFTIEEDDRELLAIPPARIDRIEMGPDVEIEAAAMRQALAHRITVALVDGRGATLGMIAAPVTDHAALHQAQAQHMLDHGLKLDLARRVVDGRIRNQRALLRRLNRRRKDPEVASAAAAIGRVLRKLPRAVDVPELFGYEGQAAALYWPAIARTLGTHWGFSRRRRRPPPDAINLILSFLSTLLYRDIHALACRHGLHPGFGTLHAARDGHNGCVSDLIEEFRAPLVEGLTVTLANTRAIKLEMFAVQDDGSCRIAPEGRDAIVRGYEAWLDRQVKSQRTGKTVLWRRVVEEQVIAYVHHLRQKGDYQSYRMDY